MKICPKCKKILKLKKVGLLELYFCKNCNEYNSAESKKDGPKENK
jgi:DNA-directed RNA polymerase subunit M/transcription elongation factor TFIIS